MRASVLQLCAISLLGPLLAFSDEPPVAPLETPYHTEQEWIVSSICRNAFELLSFAKDKKGELVAPAQVTLKEIPGDTLSYDVTVKGAHVTAEAKLRWPDSLWSPAAYVPFCQAAAQALKLPPPAPAKDQGDPLHALLDFSETAIETENHRVSQWLADQPDNAIAHEQAALILGTLAMKENSGYFWDPRDACNHACTHLAVAQFLRGSAPPSVIARLAAIDIGLIVDTKAQTGRDLDQLAAEKDPSPDLAAWINAGRMRNSRDWRIVKNPENASPYEQVEYFRAYAEAVDPDLAIGWLQTNKIANRPDWGRIVLEMGFSVDAGHIFAQNSIAQEIHTMQTTFPGSFIKTTFIADLNELPGDAVIFSGSPTGTPTVISRGMWAQFFQRHLCHAIAETGNFFANKWGVPENTTALDHVVDTNFAKLSFYPYLQLVQNEIREAPTDPAAALAFFTSHPESAADFVLWMKPSGDPDISHLRHDVTAWFNPPVVHGTAYGAMSRAPATGWPKAQVDQLYAMAPLQISVAHMEVKSLYGDQFTLPQFQKIMGPLLDYYVSVINQAKNAVGLTLEQRVQLAEKSAAISPDGYYELAQLYLDNHQEDKAADAYQQWFDHAPDRAEVSNSVEWLVNYYYDHGQTDKAMAIAKDAAEVYSSRGLETMMKLLEKMGRLDEAEGYGQKILERYDESDELAAFYKRHSEDKDTRFKAKFDDLVLKVFPLGLTKVTLASFSGPPASGMNFTETSETMQQNGLSSQQVVVALDGYGVQNEAQYTFIPRAFHFPGHAIYCLGWPSLS